MNGKETSTGWEMPFRILSLATAVGCLLSGCASGFAKFYEYVDTLSGVVPTLLQTRLWSRQSTRLDCQPLRVGRLCER